MSSTAFSVAKQKERPRYCQKSSSYLKQKPLTCKSQKQIVTTPTEHGRPLLTHKSCSSATNCSACSCISHFRNAARELQAKKRVESPRLSKAIKHPGSTSESLGSFLTPTPKEKPGKISSPPQEKTFTKL